MGQIKIISQFSYIQVHHRQWVCEAAQPQFQSGHGYLGGGAYLKVSFSTSKKLKAIYILKLIICICSTFLVV